MSFKVGDKVRCINDRFMGASVKIGNVYTVRATYQGESFMWVSLEDVYAPLDMDRFELVEGYNQNISAFTELFT